MSVDWQYAEAGFGERHHLARLQVGWGDAGKCWTGLRLENVRVNGPNVEGLLALFENLFDTRIDRRGRVEAQG